MERRLPPRVAALLALATLAWTAGARADVVHLKNGGSIACDAIEERGADLILKQGKGTIVVPRAEVLRVEKSPAARTPPPPAAGSATGSAPGASVEELKRRIEERPLASAENRRQLVALLAQAGERALTARHPEEARRRFEDALTYDASSLRCRRGLAAAHLMGGEPALARSIAEQALLEAPGDADLNLLLGEALLRQDRTTEAMAALTKAYAARPEPALKERLETLRRQQDVDGDYRRAEAARFTLAYDGERTSPALEAEILAFLESQYPELALLFDFNARAPVPVIVYPERDFYAATLAERDVAGLFDGKVRVPSGGLKRLDPDARGVLRHELAHAFIAGKSRGMAPRWLHEGLAQWVEGLRTGDATAKSLAREAKGAGPRFGSTFTYASALSFVEFLLARHGQAALNETLAEMGRGTEPDQAIDKVLRFPLTDLRAAWGDELIRRHLP